MDLVDEEDAAGLQRGEEGGDVGLALQRRAGGLDHRHPHLGGDDVGQRGLAEARRAGEEDVVERLAAAAGGLDEDRQLIGHLRLVDEVGEGRRPQRAVEVLVGDVGAGVVHTNVIDAVSSASVGGQDRRSAPRSRVRGRRGRPRSQASGCACARSRGPACGCLAQRAGNEGLRIVTLDAVEQLLGLQGRVAEVDEAVAGQRARRRRPPRHRQGSPPPRAPRRPSRAARR